MDSSPNTMAEHSTVDLVFDSDPDFCSDCGAILKIDHSSISVECLVCGNKKSLQGLLGVQSTYTIEFTPLGYYAHLKKKAKKAKKTHSEVGQMDNDRECSKCGNKGMSYTTMQLRSADEGQTVFYFCPKCRNREVENS